MATEGCGARLFALQGEDGQWGGRRMLPVELRTRAPVELLDRLVDGGNSVIVIEPSLDVIRNADWIVDLGPEGAGRGGEIVFTGTPAQLRDASSSLTGEYLRRTARVAA